MVSTIINFEVVVAVIGTIICERKSRKDNSNRIIGRLLGLYTAVAIPVVGLWSAEVLEAIKATW